MTRKGIVGRVSAARSMIMAKVRTNHTGPELTLRKQLTALGMRNSLHKKGLPGRPDIVFSGAKVAIFCDGEFWHGRNLEKWLKKGQFKVRRAYWIAKIKGNMARDLRTIGLWASSDGVYYGFGARISANLALKSRWRFNTCRQTPNKVNVCVKTKLDDHRCFVADLLSSQPIRTD